MDTLRHLEEQLREQAEQILIRLTMESSYLLRELAEGAEPYAILTELHKLLLDIRRDADVAQWSYVRQLFELPEEAEVAP